MKNHKLIFTAAFFFVILFNLQAQITPTRSSIRCGTMSRAGRFFNEQKAKLIMEGFQKQTTPQVSSHARLTSLITIPVVVHIVLPNPYLVTNADVQAQIDRLNLDFSGLNADSTNIPSQFALVRGHSQIRFCLARRTPDGKLTNGIERRSSATGSDINATNDPIKYTAEGGLDAWDPAQYLNYWVGADATGAGVLGYGQFPASMNEPQSGDGVFINYQAWGTNKCYTSSSFNMGRTAVHETGHYFGLLHTWGDDGNSCSGDDFAALSTAGSSCSLPAGLFNAAGQGNGVNDVGDTPNQSGETNGCPSTATVIDSCSKQNPGVMFQNMMDYSDDACLSMFTKKQVERMESVVANCRSGLLTSQGCQFPSNPVLLDAAVIQSVNPGGFETQGCTTNYYPSVLICSGSIVPKIRVANKGLNTISTITIGYSLNNAAPVTRSLNINLPFGADTVLSFSSASIPTGTNTFKFFTANPNNASDEVPANDTLTQTITILGSTSLPLREDFESSTFPPAGWAIDNYNGDNTWIRKSPGRNSSFSAFINNFEFDATGNIDDLKSPRVVTAGADSVIISFDLANKFYPQSSFSDTLSVLISNDCGNTFETVYKKWGAELATAGSSDESYDMPAEGDWRTERIAVTGSILSKGQISVVFRNSSQFGNNIFIDNVNIEGKKNNNLLKRRGYLVFPTVFTDYFSVAFYEPLADLRFINVYNSLGQRVLTRQFQNNTEQFFTFSLAGKAAGIYVVQMGYEDQSKNQSDFIIKQ